MRKLLWLAVLAAPLWGQRDPSAVLVRVRDNVLHTVDRLPRYLCTQTVDRVQYEPSGVTGAPNCEDIERFRGTRYTMAMTTADRLRLDVGVAQGNEAYSWVGEDRFGDQSLFDIVKEGALSTGYFHGFLALVFRSDNADFSYVGEKEEGGRRVMEFEFQVPLDASHYTFREGAQAYTTAYEGRILADPETAELIEMSVRSRNLSAETGACEVSNVMKYGRWRVQDTDFLLPAETSMSVVRRDAVESRNRTVYTGCHEFLGQSTLRFEPPPEDAGRPQRKGAPARPDGRLPAGLRFTVQLDQEIAVATAAAGDPVKAVLTSDLRSGRTVLARRGAAVVCRIQRIRRYYSARSAVFVGEMKPVDRVEVVLRLESVETPGGARPVAARRYVPPPSPVHVPRSVLQQRPVRLGPLAALGPNLWFAVFEKAGDDYVIGRSLSSEWVTAGQ